MIPNTTPTPNELYNGEMKKMSDTELRVVLIITRKTLGWEIDNETGMRKTEDWINQTQLKKLSGRGSAAISKAIDNCIKMGWIEARNKKGELLDTKDKRKRLGYAGKVYYRLGRIFLDKTIAIQKANSNNEIVYEKRTAESEQQKANRNKRNPLTKENKKQKNTATQSVADTNEINSLIGKFKPINPTYERLFRNTTQRKALERLVKKFGFKKIEEIIDILPEVLGKPYAPVITTPYLLEQKLGNLGAYLKQRSENSEEKQFII